MSRTAGRWPAVRYVGSGQVAATPAARYATSRVRCRGTGRPAQPRHPARPGAPVPAGAALGVLSGLAGWPGAGADRVLAPAGPPRPVSGPRPAAPVGSLMSTTP